MGSAVLLFSVSAIYHRGTWSPRVWSALQRFDQRTAALVRQYDAYRPLPDLKVSGALTLGEKFWWPRKVTA